MPDSTPSKDDRLIKSLGTFWTIPNILSVFRLLLVIPIGYLIINDGPLLVIAAMTIVAVFTDWLDGFLARKLNVMSDWGKVLDPLADKFAAVVIVFALTVQGSLPVWLLLLLLVRDLLIVLGGVVLRRRTGVVPMSMMPGKVAVTMLALTVVAALLRADEPILMVLVIATAVLMTYSFIVYAIRFFRPHDASEDAVTAASRGATG